MTTIDLSLDSPESKEWQDAQSLAAATYLAGLPGRAALTERLAGHLVDIRMSPAVRRGQRWFQTVALDPDAEHPVAVVRDAPQAELRVLVDPNDLSAKRGEPVSLAWTEPSPDGSLLAYAVSASGTEMYEVGLIDVATGEALPEALPWNATGLSWLADSSGFWLSSREFVDGVMQMPVFRHLIGEIPKPAVPTPAGLLFPQPVVSPDGRHVVLVEGNTEPRMDWILKDGTFQPFLNEIPGGVAGQFHGDDLIALVDDGAPRGRLVRIPVTTAADAATWTELVAESDEVLRYVDVVGDTIVLGSLRGAAARIRLIDGDGAIIDEVPLPGEGVACKIAVGAAHPLIPMFTTGDDEISFVFSTFELSPAVYSYAISERRLDVVGDPPARLDGLAVSTITAVSADGVDVLAHVVHRADLDMSVPQPTLIYGYGGFNLAYLPSYLSENAAWVEAGGIYVLAHLRGGSELGAAWWQGGRREHKQNTFNDLYAVAEHLIASGRTTAEQLAVKGESNGGLLTGAAIVQRPDLWAAVVSDVPIYDLLGMVRDPLTFAIGHLEYGDPSIPAEAEWLRAISPVENVKPANYPAVLVTAGENDPRCPTWHARTFVDLVQRAQAGEAPILLRIYGGQGHGAAGLGATADKDADWLAFAAHATGLAL
ncbi:MAG TPA: prolyl oligopeptidase family serine peptidase [Mycobacteriales bacterium]|nr:prolyl oligopeptidase family serine peptidase [Mycobacteriales bacterium]